MVLRDPLPWCPGVRASLPSPWSALLVALEIASCESRAVVSPHSFSVLRWVPRVSLQHREHLTAKTNVSINQDSLTTQQRMSGWKWGRNDGDFSAREDLVKSLFFWVRKRNKTVGHLQFHVAQVSLEVVHGGGRCRGWGGGGEEE